MYEQPDGEDPKITFGIGYANPDGFSKIFFEITPDNWAEINEAVMDAFKIAGVIDTPPPKPKVKRTRKKKEPEPPAQSAQSAQASNGSEPEPPPPDAGVVPPPTPGQPARRKVGSHRPYAEEG